MANNKRVVILGGHGKVALLATPKFKEAGFDVDNVIRDPDQKSEIERVGGTPVILDMETATIDEFAEAVRGAAAVVFSAGAGGGNPARTNAVDYEAAVRSMEGAQKAGVKRYVLVSYATAEEDLTRVDPEDSFYPYVKAKATADKHLRNTDLDYTILGPGMLTLEPASGKVAVADERGQIDGAQPDDTDTSRENVAEVMVHAVAKGAGIGQKFNFYDGQTPIAEALH
ncbi:SDR family oxidoreductase [Corynebacterium halotolerans]|uniref:SDR family oxidoreductase n=1 Tax=Corynebacterium halotolerans TaxID=225326 RepID=UPI003CF0BF44